MNELTTDELQFIINALSSITGVPVISKEADGIRLIVAKLERTKQNVKNISSLESHHAIINDDMNKNT